MPTPDPVVTTKQNADGTSTATTTQFHPNGSKKSESAVKKDSDNKKLEEVTEDFRRGTGPGPAEVGKKTKQTKKEYDAKENETKSTETEYDSKERKTKETITELDTNSNDDKITVTEFDKKGREKEKTETEFDDNGNATKVTISKYKNGRKTQEKSDELENRDGRRFKKVITIIYCPDPEIIKTRISEEYHWAGQEWRIDKSKTVIDRWDCKTGNKIAMAFPGSPRVSATCNLQPATCNQHQ